MEKLNNCLLKGILPDELNYTKSRDEFKIDWEKVKYNSFYKTPEYFDKRFNPCIKSLPGYETILNNIVIQNKDNSLTEEMKLRKSIINDDTQTLIHDVEYKDIKDIINEN
jgi:hypothetical protein